MMLAPATRLHGDVATHFSIEPLFPSALPEVAGFLHRERHAEHSAEDSDRIERRLRWLLVENPAARPTEPVGHCIRDSWGAIRGADLYFPSTFLCADSRLSGLCSGSFFVDPAARSLGFYLFKKYLAARGYAFFFATTCNRNSEPLWRRLGARAVPNSEIEYILPLRMDLLLSAKVPWSLARFGGRCVNPVLRFLTRRAPDFSVYRCEDWEKLAALSRTHHVPKRVSTERREEFLEWRYGRNSPARPCNVYIFRDRQGNEGWFALGYQKRGTFQRALLLDAVWPRRRFSFKDVFARISAVAAESASALFFRRQPGFERSEYCRLAIPHKLDARTFVIGAKNSPSIDLRTFDYDDNDYLAWMPHPNLAV